MKRIGMYIVCLFVLGKLQAQSRRADTTSKEVVLIETAQIGETLRDAMKPDVYERGEDSVTYVDRNSQVHIVQVSNSKGNRSYVFQKNQGLVLELRPAAGASKRTTAK